MREETKEHEDQAEELRRLLDEVEGNKKEDEQSDTTTEVEEEEPKRDVDILNLPPRKEVHGGKNTGTRFKISGASLRMITVLIVFILIIGFAYYLWGPELLDIISNL